MASQSSNNAGAEALRSKTCFWKEVREYLETRDSRAAGQTPAPIASCPICEAELDILFLPLSNGSAAGTRRAMVTICGHLVCHICSHKWRDTCKEQEREISCPYCRYVLHFPEQDCQHTMRRRALPRNNELGVTGLGADSESFPAKVPLTIPEGGAQPSRCNDCRWALIRESELDDLKGEFNHQRLLLRHQPTQKEWVAMLREYEFAKADLLQYLERKEKAERKGWGRSE